MKSDSRIRCWKTDNPLYMMYHDEEWRTPVHDDRTLFELIVLEGFQAGLTWELILRRRDVMKKAFEGFDIEKMAWYTEADVARLLNTPGMIRNRAKIMAAINNAQMVREVKREFGSFDAYIWRFVDGKTIDHRLKDFSEMPSESEESREMSRDLKRRGFQFVGPTICYSFMQAVGMVNDHLVHCFRYKEINQITNAS